MAPIITHFFEVVKAICTKHHRNGIYLCRDDFIIIIKIIIIIKQGLL
jgi:hypothetical protein